MSASHMLKANLNQVVQLHMNDDLASSRAVILVKRTRKFVGNEWFHDLGVLVDAFDIGQ